MTGKTEAAHTLRQQAIRLRTIAAESETKLSGELRRIAQILDDEADEAEVRQGENRPGAGDGATAP